MLSRRFSPAFVIILALAGASQAQCQAPPAEQSPQPPPASASALPAPAIKAGDTLTDRDGVAVGDVQALVESPAGPLVVVRIDGKMVSLAQSTLRMEGDRIVSAQTRDQMLAAAGAPG
jgi:hypothetical protein